MSANRKRTTKTTIGVDRRRGVFMISVAAELAEMHPQTLRMYEARGLITPKRSAKNTRLCGALQDGSKTISNQFANQGRKPTGADPGWRYKSKLSTFHSMGNRMDSKRAKKRPMKSVW